MKRWATARWAMAVLVLMGCDGQRTPVPDEQAAFESLQAFRRDVFKAPPESQLDVLFVIDNSASMCRAQANLTRNLDRLFDLTNRVDIRLAVTSTDLSDSAHRGAFLTAPAAPVAQPQCLDTDGVPFVPQTAGCADRALSPILRLPYGGSVEELAEARADLACMTTLGTRGDDVGRGLEAMRLALSCGGPNADRFAACCVDGAFDPTCTAEVDFLRPEAVLMVVFLSDTDDCSAPDTNRAPQDVDRCAWQRDELTPVDEYVRFLAHLKPRPSEQILVAPVVGGRLVTAEGDLVVFDAGPYPQPACDPNDAAYDPALDFTDACCPGGRCRGPVRASCESESVVSAAGYRYLDFEETFTGRACPAGEPPGPDCLSICSNEYSVFGRLLWARISYDYSLCLAQAPAAQLGVELECTDPGCQPGFPPTTLIEGVDFTREPNGGCASGEAVSQRSATIPWRQSRSVTRLTYSIDPPTAGRAAGSCPLPAACAEPIDDPYWTDSTRICVVEGGCGSEDCISWESGPAHCAPRCTRDADCGAGRCASPLGIPDQQPSLCATAPCHCLP